MTSSNRRADQYDTLYLCWRACGGHGGSAGLRRAPLLSKVLAPVQQATALTSADPGDGQGHRGAHAWKAPRSWGLQPSGRLPRLRAPAQDPMDAASGGRHGDDGGARSWMGPLPSPLHLHKHEVQWAPWWAINDTHCSAWKILQNIES